MRGFTAVAFKSPAFLAWMVDRLAKVPGWKPEVRSYGLRTFDPSTIRPASRSGSGHTVRALLGAALAEAGLRRGCVVCPHGCIRSIANSVCMPEF